MSRFMIRLTAMLGLLAAAFPAQAIRPVTSSFTFGAGSSHLADTYLTPLNYDGWQASFTYERLQAMKFSPENWVMKLDIGLQLDRTLNPSRNSTMWYGGVEASWAMMRRWRLPQGFSAGVGSAASLDAGCLLKASNGNNPASAKAALTVDATAYAAWNGKAGRLPVTLRYDARIPVTGAFFSPDYDELYYEIWLGNHSGLVHPVWWGNYFRFDSRLSASLHFGATTLKIGYRFDMLTTDVCNITTRVFRHSALLGIESEWISLSSQTDRLSSNARIISATY